MLVIDASIATKWVIDEPGSDKARALLKAGESLQAPTLLLLEVHNTLAKRFHRREIAFVAFSDAISQLRSVLELRALTDEFVLGAWKVSLTARSRPGAKGLSHGEHAFSIYDSIYIAMAAGLDAPLVTSDLMQAQTAEHFGVAVRVL